jgi:hypothetical protein
MIADRKVLFNIQLKLYTGCRQISNRHKAPVPGLALNEMNIGSREVCLLAILLSLFQNGFVSIPAGAFDAYFYNLIKGRIFGNIDGFRPVALRAGKGRHLFTGYIYFLVHSIQPIRHSFTSIFIIESRLLKEIFEALPAGCMTIGCQPIPAFIAFAQIQNE